MQLAIRSQQNWKTTINSHQSSKHESEHKQDGYDANPDDSSNAQWRHFVAMYFYKNKRDQTFLNENLTLLSSQYKSMQKCDATSSFMFVIWVVNKIFNNDI